MPQQLLEYRCPSCGASLQFDSASQQVVCPYCDSSFTPQSLIDYDSFLREDAKNQTSDSWTADPERWDKDEATGLNVYTCAACGGEVLGDDTLASARCPFCDNAVIMKRQFTGDWKPDLVLPFKLDRKAAQDAFRKHLHGKKLLPKAFRSESCIEEIKGMYVPFWLFSSHVSASMRFKGSKSRAWTDGRYDYVETSRYALLRAADATFTRIPADGSQKMDDALMDSLEPFDVSETQPFDMRYLAGFAADRFDQPRRETEKRARARMLSSAQSVASSKASAGYGSARQTGGSLRADLKARYLLFPVYLFDVLHNGNSYHFAVNGQSGKVVGNLPVDRGVSLRYFLLRMGVVLLALLGVSVARYYMGR